MSTTATKKAPTPKATSTCVIDEANQTITLTLPLSPKKSSSYGQSGRTGKATYNILLASVNGAAGVDYQGTPVRLNINIYHADPNAPKAKA